MQSRCAAEITRVQHQPGVVCDRHGMIQRAGSWMGRFQPIIDRTIAQPAMFACGAIAVAVMFCPEQVLGLHYLTQRSRGERKRESTRRGGSRSAAKGRSDSRRSTPHTAARTRPARSAHHQRITHKQRRSMVCGRHRPHYRQPHAVSMRRRENHRLRAAIGGGSSPCGLGVRRAVAVGRRCGCAAG